MSTTELIHVSAALDALQKKLEGLKARADSLIVSDQTGCIAAKNLKLDIQAYMKAVKFETGPEIEIKKGELRQLQEQEKMLLAPAEAMLEISERKRKDWENEERRKAEEEQRRINEENQRQARIKAETERREAERAAAVARDVRVSEIRGMQRRGEIGKREAARLLKLAGADLEAAKESAAAQAEETAKSAPVVQVKPNIPTVAGVQSRQNYKFEVINPSEVGRAWQIPDLVAIGQRVRADKNPEKSMMQIGGIRVWAE